MEDNYIFLCSSCHRLIISHTHGRMTFQYMVFGWTDLTEQLRTEMSTAFEPCTASSPAWYLPLNPRFFSSDLGYLVVPIILLKVHKDTYVIYYRSTATVPDAWLPCCRGHRLGVHKSKHRRNGTSSAWM